MKLKEIYQKLNSKIKRFLITLKRMPWFHIFIIFICVVLSTTVFLVLESKCFKTIDESNTLTNLLTVNGIFSAILITYLFSRITWSKERKLEIFKEAISISQKITDYRRVLNKLTEYYNVWNNEKATKSLLENWKFKTIDFYDYWLFNTPKVNTSKRHLIKELMKHDDFSEGESTLYLAMASLTSDRNNPNYQWKEELYSDFEIRGIYNIKIVEKWLECNIFGSIWFWLDQDYDYMNYPALKRDHDYILAAITRINKKYEGIELSNKLLKEVTNEISSHYLNELHLRLKGLQKGITDLNLIIIILITSSLIFGVLIPFVLLLVQSKTYLFSLIVGTVVSINSGLIAYFILRFPTIIRREIKWI